ncbi:MAG: hypothetical protein MUP09_01685 [Thiovulaceae bacterium]|nr:hypothetical protein [Sulfurimonadaceae bacterium]
MKHSFITPRRKKVVGAELKWLFSVFLFLAVILSGNFLFLNHTIEKDVQELKSIELKKQKLLGEQKTAVAEIERLQKLDKLRETISTINRLKKENVKNFFDLVPDEMTLEFVAFRDKTLRLKGVTKSRAHFEETFQRSLESLFSRSATRFTELENGSFRFDNISVTEAENE